MENKNLKVTLDAYENGLDGYINNTFSVASGFMNEHLERALSKIKKDADILEIGSGPGRDANYIETLSYKILRTDAATSFVEYLKSQGKEVLQYDAIAGGLHKQFDLIFATAVFLHFTEAQFVQALKNTHRHLREKGYFALTLKIGEGEEYKTAKMSDQRFFKYWKETKVCELLKDNGFETINTATETSQTNQKNKILLLLTRKIS